MGWAFPRRLDIFRQAETTGLGPFLQLGLGVAMRAAVIDQKRPPEPIDKPPRNFKPAIKEQCADDRFTGVGLNSGIGAGTCALLALGQHEITTKVEIGSNPFQRLAPHQSGKPPGKRAFRFLRMLGQQDFSNHQGQHAVTQEFKPLVTVSRRSRQPHRTTMGQGFAQ